MSRSVLLAIAGGLLLVALTGVAVDALGGTNPYTPPGHEGYVTHQPLVFGQRVFVGGQVGPASPGFRWRQYATNIDMRPRTLSEHMEIFSSDNLEVSFEVHARIRLREGTVQEVVERYSGNDWYENNARRPYRTAVREIVRQHPAFAIKDRSEELAALILARLRGEFAQTPIDFMSISIGNITYPESVERQVVANLAAEQRRQRMEVERRIATLRAQIRETHARGDSRAQEIEQETLTSLYVQHEAAELYRALADETVDDDGVARADVVVVIPTRADRAGVPRIFDR